jgi:hypothetical protein
MEGGLQSLSAKMYRTARLLRSHRITLFTRTPCGLCDEARTVLTEVQKRAPFEHVEVDIGAADNKAWRDLYAFDIPVVRPGPDPSRVERTISHNANGIPQVHISKAQDGPESPTNVGKAVKLMHRFTPEDVLAKMESAK